jgi:hypothetical protein
LFYLKVSIPFSFNPAIVDADVKRLSADTLPGRVDFKRAVISEVTRGSGRGLSPQWACGGSHCQQGDCRHSRYTSIYGRQVWTPSQSKNL